MGIKVPNGSGGYTDLIGIKRPNGSGGYVDCQFAKAYDVVTGLWENKWVRARTILNPGAWVTGGITGWGSYAVNPFWITPTLVAGQYLEILATSSYTGGGTNTVLAVPTPVNMTGFTKLKIVYGTCNPYPGITFLNIGATQHSLDNVSGQTVVYNISGNANIGIQIGATSAQNRYIRIVSMELS